MPEIKVKTVYIEKLKQLGVYDKWLVNLQRQWFDARQYTIDNASNFHQLISYSFVWYISCEDEIFWKQIANS